ncbi:pullulanase-type alpha-1,6-glucosidase [Cellulomonas sp.]|uniref:pullulanase-type alpha-1,6-glucosidase n=1 Tax=Cellulomonas sp. TaxID=40001 RepID=UPI00281185F5|nr:pullulanase-type alpha-1,6-glucosidase [Cellulomonas sp.]
MVGARPRPGSSLPPGRPRPAPSHRPRLGRRLSAAGTALAVGAVGAIAALVPTAASAAPGGVALVGSLQSELGCAADWDPACPATELAPTDVPGRFAATFEVPEGAHEWKVALDDAWDASYGADGTDANTPLVLAGPARLTFTYDDTSHRTAVTVTDLRGGYTDADADLVAEPVRDPGAGEQFYFVMTDRFANADPSNDTGGLEGDRLVTGLDPTDKGFFHGGDVAGLRERLDYVEGLGTTAIWLTPSFLNRPVQGEGADASAGYHGYWVTDFTRIDPHLGTNEELEALIDEAHARGIKVYFDIITNHTADVIDYAEKQYTYVEQSAEPYRDAAGEAFDPADLAGTDDFPALDPATSFPYTPVVDPADADLKVPAWLNDPTLYHNRGNSTWTGESVTYGDFDGLDDLMTEHPDVVQGFVDVYEAWVDLGIDGFRIDTVKHVNGEFWETFTAGIAEHAASVGNPDFFMFGEVYDADSAKTAPYVRDTDMNAVLDFSFQAAAANYAKGLSAAGLQALYASDDRYTTPTSNAQALPTFLGNHDMGRIGYAVKDAGSAQDRSGLAHTLMYLTRGQPVVYYGDEQGFVGAGSLGGKDKDARQSLFATQVPEYADQALLDGTTAGSVDRFGTDTALYRHIARLAELRASTPALTEGAQVERYADGPVYAFSRVGDDDVEHLVATNNATTAATVTVDTLTPGATFTPLLATTGTTTADAQPVTAAADGTVELAVPALGAVVLRADAPVAAGDDAITLTVPGAGAAVTGSAPVVADVADDVLATTSFAYRVVGSDGWTPLGTAETTSPRVYHDVDDLAPGTLVEYRAVREDVTGGRSAASTYASVGVAVDGVVPPTDPTDLVVSVPGSHNAAMGCPGDWQPDCEAARLEQVAGSVYAGTFTLAPGSYEYKVAIGGTWDENYGAGGAPGGANITYTVAGDAPQQVTFVYDHATHQATSSAQGALITLPGSAQSELGCAADWDPACLAAVLIDGDGDGTAVFTAPDLPAGTYEVKVAHGLSWAENYGAGGAAGGANIAFSTPGGQPVTFTYDLATHVLTVGVADPPLPGTGQAAAYWVEQDLLAWPTSLVPAGTDAADLTFTLHGDPAGALEVVEGEVTGGETHALAVDPDGLEEGVLARFPALEGYLALRLADADRATVERLLTGELLVRQAGADGAGQAVTGVQVPGVLDDLYADRAADRTLGTTWRKGAPSLALWAPTAQDVDLLVWPADRRGRLDTSAEPTRVAAERQRDGAWTAAGPKAWAGAAYLWEVTVYAPTTGKVEVNRVTDPYAVALTLNSTHGVLVDLDDPRYRPREWERTRQPVVRPVDQTIYELHVRDFSISDATVPERLRGTYGAFAVRRSDGRDHLRRLADAGLTTVHLLPTFDIASIEEDRAQQATPQCDLASLPPDSPEQQACVTAVAGRDAFNWGYDPWHWTVPEGSYAVDATGGARIAEFRSMVGALHADGLQVVLDQVFNHTAASGQDAKSVLDRVVPGYYHRLNATGQVETSTCCQNVATEHAMAEKMMVDSVITWARDHKVDGFRFDLMGHHSRQTMEKVRAALDDLTPRRDGVDGSKVYLYGEGWNFGEVADDRLFEQATQGQLGGTGIGTFSDRLRDAVRGGGPFDENPRAVQGFGSGAYTDPNGDPGNGTPEEQLARVRHQADLVRLGMAGNLRDYRFLTSAGEVQQGDEIDYNGQPAGYADSPEEVVTYVDAHDNETLFDNLYLKLPQDTPMADRVRMNTVSLATTALAQTPSFWHAGADLLRSKSLDRNSYDSGDWFNVLDWSGQTNGFARGLPPAADNEAKWPYQQPLLADPALVPTPQDVATASEAAAELLELRSSTRLFRLGSADLIRQKVTFPGSGPDADPGVVVMHVDDRVGWDRGQRRWRTDVDRRLDGVLVVVNASDEPTTQTVEALAGRRYALSPVQARGHDPVVRTTTWQRGTGTVTVPPRTVAVLVEQAPHGSVQDLWDGLGDWWRGLFG